jgi:glycosyltransferase involved in cell wall biosynthesis
MIKVSILMNCYNGEKYLAEAIDSIYAQTYQNWEIIFIDNCSTDKSAEIANSYDERIKYYKTEKNIELGDARVFGLQYCAGEFLAFLDTDDCYLPSKLEKQLDQLNTNSNYQMSYSGGFFIDECSKIIGQFTPKACSGFVLPQQLRNYEINMQSVMIRNNQTIKFNKSLEFSPDYDLFMQICAAYKVGVIQESLIKYRKLKNSLTSKKISKWGVEMQITLDKLFADKPNFKVVYFKEYQLAYAKVAYYKARYLFSKNRQKQAVEILATYKYSNLTYFLIFFLALMPIFVWNRIHKFK